MDQEGNIKERKDFEEKRKQEKKASPILYFNIGFYLVTPILVGLGVGLMFDHWFKTKPVCTILFLLLGMMGSFYNLFTLQKK